MKTTEFLTKRISWLLPPSCPSFSFRLAFLIPLAALLIFLPALLPAQAQTFSSSFWRTFTTDDGLVDNTVWAIYQDNEGTLWFGTDSGVSGYDGGVWRTFTTADGLADSRVRAIYQDHEGALWFGTGSGVSRYEAGTWRTFTTADGLVNNRIRAIYPDNEGAMWFATEGGVSRYQGETWRTFTTDDGLVNNNVGAICEDDDGKMWFATESGVSRYHGGQWQTFTTKDGLANNSIWVIYQDNEGVLWFGTYDGGVSRYQRGQWQTFTTNDGLGGIRVRAIYQDDEGALWFGAEGGGVSRYQGGQWQRFTSEDGLADNSVRAVYQDKEGILWFGTSRGVSRYQRGTMPPGVWLTSVNGRPFEKDALLNLSPDIDHLTVEFEGGDAATRTEDLVYMHRLVGVSETWMATDQHNAVYPDLLPGRYIFQVKALDRDGNFSEPAQVEIVVPWWSLTLLYGYGLTGLIGLAMATVGFNRWQKQRRTRQAIARKENPYIANVPVKDPTMFFGREDILRQIVNGVHLNNFAVCGPKRIGKTSLLHRLTDVLPQLKDAEVTFRTVMVSLHGVAEIEFFQTLGEAIAAQARSEPIELALPGRDPQASYGRYNLLADLDTLRAAWQATSAKPVRLILLIDEGDVLNEYSQRTLAQLRYVFMGPGLGFLGMVWTGEKLDQRPWTLSGSDWLTLFGDVFYLAPLTEIEAVRLIQEPVPYYHYDKEAVRLILDESKLIPHRIQLLCRAAVEEMLKEGRGQIKVKHIELASRALTNLPYRVAPMTDVETKKQLAETRTEYQTEPDDEDTK